MNIKPIRTNDDLHVTFKRLESIFQAGEGTAEADEMEVLVTLIEAYEKNTSPLVRPIRWRPPNSEWNNKA